MADTSKKRKGDNKLHTCDECEKKDAVIDQKAKQLELNTKELVQKTPMETPMEGRPGKS
jgi:hypothetical protein